MATRSSLYTSLLVLAVALTLTPLGPLGCTPRTVRATLTELQARAAFDLACPQSWLRLYNFNARAKGISGCGRQLSYVEACELLDGELICTWEADGPVNAITAPAPQGNMSAAPGTTPSMGSTPAPAQPTPQTVDPLGDRY